ncbi:MAG TPA: penicillin-binding transpeptidase domain-containing protein [Gemmatimonadaceae bacterium]|nr:penicillin-binding transpeptidase domain-containing protein [Gemmatimonadaceae bacterium]
MKRISRLGAVNLSLLGFAGALLGRAVWVQLWQGNAWAARAERQHFTDAPVPAPRGDVLDATGERLAESREMVRLAIAPREVRGPAVLRRALGTAGVAREWVLRATDTRRAWVVIPGRFLPSDVAQALPLRGVYSEPVSERVYALTGGMRGLVGQVNAEGTAVEGIELALDSLLRGTAGSSTLIRDARGRKFEAPNDPGVAPTKGHSVTLTLNHELQEICERALADAVSTLGASGGDIVVLDPHDGALLAMASRREGAKAGVTGLTEPFEPGSTIKPLVAAALLQHGRVRPGDRVDAHGGSWTIFGRTIHDVHQANGPISLRDAIRLSSNIGIAQFAERLTPGEQYQALRDFGFGTPTGVSFPSEASGTLRPPKEWSKLSAASLAMGYEIAVTPLQLAAAYGAVANGGELLEPALVREIRDPDGTVRFHHERRVVRRVISSEIAAQVRSMLGEAVERGTGLQADLSTFAVAGKTGTARLNAGGGYAQGKYYASFVGLFPADAPQYVIVVKLDDPAKGYGAVTAAPVTKAVLEAALAARDAALDRGALASRSLKATAQPARDSSAEQAADSAAGAVPVVVALDAPVAGLRRDRGVVAVPDTRGMPLREAVAALHGAGLQVQLGRGTPGTTEPAAGSRVPRGTTVRLMYEDR